MLEWDSNHEFLRPSNLHHFIERRLKTLAWVPFSRFLWQQHSRDQKIHCKSLGTWRNRLKQRLNPRPKTTCRAAMNNNLNILKFCFFYLCFWCSFCQSWKKINFQFARLGYLDCRLGYMLLNKLLSGIDIYIFF